MEDSPSFVTVTELNFYLNKIINSEELLRGILLLGEVSGISYKGTTSFFTVKDEKAQIAVCCFNAQNTYAPQNGEKVLLRGSPEYYQKTGKMTYIAYEIKPYGLGELFVEIERRKERLRDEGIFNPDHKKSLPKYPKKIGVVTSINGAVISDIVTTIRKKNTLIDILVADTKVQGEGASQDMIRALKAMDKQGMDAIILARGGGSAEDLMPFNDENLARTLYNMQTFVISAVGHETDYSISDMAADVRALTPTAGAEMLTYSPDELIDDIVQKLYRASYNISSKIEMSKSAVLISTNSIRSIIASKLDNAFNKVNGILQKGSNLVKDNVNSKERKVELLLSKASTLNPASLIEKGYFKVVRNSKNAMSASEFVVGDNIKIYSTDGNVSAVVTDVNLKEDVK